MVFIANTLRAPGRVIPGKGVFMKMYTVNYYSPSKSHIIYTKNFLKSEDFRAVLAADARDGWKIKVKENSSVRTIVSLFC